MVKEKLMQLIRENLSDDVAEKQTVLAYISGESNLFPKKIKKPAMIEDGPTWVKYITDPEIRKILLRLFQLLRDDMINMQSLSKTIYQNIYSIFHFLGLPETFVKEDIIYYFTTPQLQFHHQLSNFYKNDYSFLDQIFECYPQIVSVLIDEFEQDSDEKQFLSLFFFMYTIHRQSEQGFPIDGRWESVVFSLMRTVFTEEDIEKTLVKYQTTPKTLESFRSCPSFRIHMDRKLCVDLLFHCFRCCYDITPASEDAVCLTIMLLPIETLFYPDSGENREKRFFYGHKLAWLLEFRYHIWTSVNSFSRYNVIEAFDDVVENFLAVHEKAYFNLLYDFRERRDLSAAPLVAQLLKSGRPEGTEHLDWLNIRLTEYYTEFLWVDKSFYMTPNWQELEKKFDLKNRNAQAPDFKAPSGFGLGMGEKLSSCTMMFSSIYLMDYSVIAFNIVKMILKNIDRNFETLNFLVSCGYFCKEKQKNIYSYLYNTGLPFDLIIKAHFGTYCYINRKEPPELETQFSAFLREHKEEAENQILFLDIGEFCMIRYLQYLFEANQCFDIKKALLAFQKKTTVILEYLLKLLEDKETFVRQEVEALQNSKHKGTAETAARLVRLWDNRIMGALLDAQPDSWFFMDQIEKRYTKFHEQSISMWSGMPYGTIRMAGSDTFLSEKVMKYYLAEYMLLKTIYPVNACLKIQQKANLDDLRHLLKKIYEIWLAEGAPFKLKNLLLPFALTAGENEILILKNQIAEWSDNGNPALALFAIKALFMNGSEPAIMLIKEIAKTIGNKKVRTAALEALSPIS